MAEFIEFEVGVEEDIEEEEDDKVSDDSDLDSLSSFIDKEEKDNDVSFYRWFNNVETDIEETLKAEYEKGLYNIENFDEISNLCESSENEPEIDDFNRSSEKVKSFSESLLPQSNSDEETVHNNFIRVYIITL